MPSRGGCHTTEGGAALLRTGPGAILGTFAGGGGVDGCDGVSTGRFVTACGAIAGVRAALEDAGRLEVETEADAWVRIGGLDGPGALLLFPPVAVDPLATVLDDAIGRAGGFRSEDDPLCSLET